MIQSELMYKKELSLSPGVAIYEPECRAALTTGVHGCVQDCSTRGFPPHQAATIQKNVIYIATFKKITVCEM